MSSVMLEFKNATKHYTVRNKGERRRRTIAAVDDVSFAVPKGTTVAVVGESGSGKTTLARLAMKFEALTGGSLLFEGKDISSMKARKELFYYRSKVQMVHQDPASSLNPSMTIGRILEQPLLVHRYGTKEQRADRVRQLLQLVELPADFAARYPHMLSGGQKQRVGIARAISLNSELIILDEPTSALDVSVQARIMELLKQLQRTLGLTYLFITHDLALVKNTADHVVVMQAGKRIETGTAHDIFTSPRAAYTRKLIKSIPVVSEEEEDYLRHITL
ncbi:ABC transporter ATP-binding protein [Cohnella hongkongensis]|uniref:ABC transporter ATP-binding protein n=1 Tax=Cohnella hongkongensis TaxID=178337 RepID=A0ABV9F4C3_9BACL